MGRVYSYDNTYKLLILKTVTKPATPEEAFSDSVMINARNIKHCEIFEAPVSTTAPSLQQE